MNKKIKTTFQFILAGTLLASFAVTGCNNEGDSKEAVKDSVATEKPMEVAPAAPADSPKKKDTASTRPTAPGH